VSVAVLGRVSPRLAVGGASASATALSTTSSRLRVWLALCVVASTCFAGWRGARSRDPNSRCGILPSFRGIRARRTLVGGVVLCSRRRGRGLLRLILPLYRRRRSLRRCHDRLWCCCDGDAGTQRDAIRCYCSAGSSLVIKRPDVLATLSTMGLL